MSAGFIPPYPRPHRRRSSLAMRFLRGWNSWIHILFEKSYTMRMGEIHTPAQSFYIANELSLVDRILADEAADFPKHRFLQEMLDPLIGDSVFSANGDGWRAQRAMVNPAFSHAALGTVFPLMSAAAADLVARIAARGADRPLPVDPLMTQVTGDIIYRTLFSQVLDDSAAAIIHRAFVRYQRAAQSSAMLRIYGLPDWPFRRAARSAAAAIHRVFAPIVETRHAAYHPPAPGEPEPPARDILDSLLMARAPGSGTRFSLPQLMGQVSTIFLAGHETSASALTWALFILSRCPESQAAIRAEVAAAGGPTALDAAGLRNLHATRNLFRETLRLYPPVSFLLREAVSPTVMRDKRIAPGAMMVVAPWLIQRNAEHWPDPHRFDPDRFDAPEQRDACRHAFLPFGKGPRICIGAGFAMQEAMLVIAHLVGVFRIEPGPGRMPEPVSRLTLRPRAPVQLRFVPHEAG